MENSVQNRTEHILNLMTSCETVESDADGLLTEHSTQADAMARSSILEDAYKGETAYILTCGPSLGRIWDTKLQSFLAGKLVIAVKQALELDPAIADFHLYNEVRMKDYAYHPATVRLGCSRFMKEHPPHVHYPVNGYTYDQALFVTNRYADWSLDQSFVRPWGIGIMFELGLFLPVYLGCSRILIMGFDMNSAGQYHFYDTGSEMDSSHYEVDDEEFGYARSSIHHYLDWTKTRNVEVKAYSPLSTLPIPQVEDIESWE